MQPLSRLHRVLARTVAAALMVPIIAIPLAETASAAPTPATRNYGPAVDAYPSYEAETSCSPTSKPGVVALRSLLNRTYGTISSNIVRSCSSSASGHEEGRALDWMTNVKNTSQRAAANAYIAWLIATDRHGNKHAMTRRLGVQYVIWNNRMWRAYDTGRGWTEYNGCFAKAKAGSSYDSYCHRNHVHTSFSWDGAYQRTSFASGFVACPAFPTPSSAPALPTQGVDYVPLAPKRVLGTVRGIGSAYGPCRVRGGTRFDLPVLGKGGVPTSGVSAVVLRVSFYNPDSSTSLRVWATGSTAPVDPVTAARPGEATALVTVPVGYGGKVSLQHLRGMSHLTADVVGYYRATSLVGARLHMVGPKRALNGVTVRPGKTAYLNLATLSGKPSVRAGVLSVTIAAGSSNGAIAPYVPNAAVPTYGQLAFWAGHTQTGSLLVQTGPKGAVALQNTSKTSISLTVDLHAVYADASVSGGKRLVPLRQTRLVDTRTDVGINGALTSGRTATFAVLGKAGIPSSGVAGVLLTGLALNATRNTTTTLWPAGSYRPGIRQMSPLQARPSGDLMVVRPGTSGQLSVRNALGTTDLTVDAVGYFH